MVIRQTWRGYNVGDHVYFVDERWNARRGYIVRIQREIHEPTKYLIDVYSPRKIFYVEYENMGRVIDTELERHDREDLKAIRGCKTHFSQCLDCDLHNRCSRYIEHAKKEYSKVNFQE